MKILVIEDSPFILRMCEIVLKEAGHTVIPVATGEQALPVLKEPLDLIITDLDLGVGISGLEFLTRVRATNPAVPVLVMSGNFTEAERAAITRYPKTALLKKPFMLHEFLEKITAI